VNLKALGGSNIRTGSIFGVMSEHIQAEAHIAIFVDVQAENALQGSGEGIAGG
jgi:hypothetical protein